MSEDRTAKRFLSLGIQHWGQSQAERDKAKSDYLKAAGFNLVDDNLHAEDWLKRVLSKMPWGKYENEADHLEHALAERKTAI